MTGNKLVVAGVEKVHLPIGYKSMRDWIIYIKYRMKKQR